MEQLTTPFFVPASRWKGAAAFFCRGALLPVFLMLLLSGCAQLQIVGPDAARLTSTVVTRIDVEPLFAAAPGGKQVAFSHEGVRVMPLPSGKSRSLSSERPLALAWSPDGGRLAVAFGRGTGSRIAVFDAAGVSVAETSAAGRVGALFWTGTDLILAVTMELETFKFGTSCREVLLSWELAGAPVRTMLHEITLMPHTVRKLTPGALIRAVSPALSPLGDELVYGRIQDPPAFDAHMKIMVRNISSGAEREIAKTGLNDGAARFSADGEELFIANGSGQIRRIAPWNGAEKPAAPFPGGVIAVSPNGRHLLADGRLLDDGREAALFPPWVTGEFLDDGRLLVVDNDTLFLVSGLGAPVPGAALPPEKRERLRTIRAWRASGLISDDDYISAREKVIK